MRGLNRKIVGYTLGQWLQGSEKHAATSGMQNNSVEGTTTAEIIPGSQRREDVFSEHEGHDDLSQRHIAV